MYKLVAFFKVAFTLHIIYVHFFVSFIRLTNYNYCYLI